MPTVPAVFAAPSDPNALPVSGQATPYAASAPVSPPSQADTFGPGAARASQWRPPTSSPAPLLPLGAPARPAAVAAVHTTPLVPVWRASVEPLLTRADIDTRVAQLGAEITRDYATTCDSGLVMMGVLVGAGPFFMDLARHIDLPVQYDFVRLASYGSGHESSGDVKMKIAPSASLAGKHVIVVEDIVDTGFSMQMLLSHLHQQQPASVEVCTLLTKPSRMQVPIDAKYVGFEVPNKFVVGYGLDDDERYRNLPFVGVLNTP